MRSESTTNAGIYDPQFVSGLFSRMSRSYERMNIVLSFGFSVRWRRQLMALIPDSDRARSVIDLMTGMGETWNELLRRFPEAELAALDNAPGMVEHARDRNARRFGGRFAVLCEDVLASDLPSGHFDVVVSAYGLKTFDAEQSLTLAEEVVRILKPGGHYAFIEVTEPPHKLLRALYGFYLRLFVPVIGSLLVSDPVEYRMLYRYLRAYGSGARSEAAFRRPELTLERRHHFFGCATSFSGMRL